MSDQLSQLRQHAVTDSAVPQLNGRSRTRSFRLEILIGIILLSTGVIGAFWVRQAGQDTVQVLGAVRELPAGHLLTEADVVVVDVSRTVDDQFVSIDSIGAITGAVLSVDIPAGPLARAAVQSAQQILGDGEVLIASAMDQGTFPPSLSAGDVVAIVITPSLSSVDGDVERLAQTATVFSIAPASDYNGKTVVTLRTEAAVAERVAASGPVHLSIVQIGGVQ